jgi:hypothetical protein
MHAHTYIHIYIHAHTNTHTHTHTHTHAHTHRALMNMKRSLRAEWLKAEEQKRIQAAARAAFLRSSLVLQAYLNPKP